MALASHEFAGSFKVARMPIPAGTGLKRKEEF